MVPLFWKRRLQICIGVARGLHYLHTGVRGAIDVASSSLVARNHDTFAYCDPEYAACGILTVKSNVFSFGVVLLEVVSAKEARDLYLECEVGCVVGDVGLDEDRGDDIFSAGKLSYGVYGLGQEGKGSKKIGYV
ncbi:unnamed protein product [Sphenostylis stenocarpa]|uniref:Protein kinase domain-containing protein n=1 Tax=Sphenostylis stenocarpa TaxID=92480 RepID=A0AA86RN33_9FABA|nr:unnamed protein product [Sphenostylis stenocarpa]